MRREKGDVGGEEEKFVSSIRSPIPSHPSLLYFLTFLSSLAIERKFYKVKY
jgi:hypothetical protein